jgi:predicted NUDIX family NTP pyrophosphohydrolase
VAARSAGLLLYRRTRGRLEVLLVHPGGPFWASKDLGAWSIPKGELEPGEEPLDTARREFTEELGARPPTAGQVELGSIRQRAGKEVVAWAVEGDLDVAEVSSSTFELEWPPRSGRTATFPEVDRAEWFDLATARTKANPAQVELIDRLEDALTDPG